MTRIHQILLSAHPIETDKFGRDRVYELSLFPEMSGLKKTQKRHVSMETMGSPKSTGSEARMADATKNADQTGDISLSDDAKIQTYLYVKELIYRFVRDRLEKTDTHVTFNRSNVYIVSFTYILGNWKALLSTTLPDEMYYEVTYSAAKQEAYVAWYKRFEDKRIGLGPIQV